MSMENDTATLTNIIINQLRRIFYSLLIKKFKPQRRRVKKKGRQFVKLNNNSVDMRNMQFKGRKSENLKGCLWMYIAKCICHLVSINVSFQLKSVV